MSVEVGVVYSIGIMMFGVALFYVLSTKPITIYNQGKPLLPIELTNVKNIIKQLLNLCLSMVVFLY